MAMAGELDRPVMTDRDHKVLEEYESYREPEDPEELADYLNMLGRLVIATSTERSYDVNQLMKMNGVAQELRDGDRTVEEAREWMEDFDAGGVSA